MNRGRVHHTFVLATAGVLLSLVLVQGVSNAGTLYKAETGPFGVTVIDREWVDDARGRAVPARLFVPDSPADEQFPVIVFSHGLWANRQSYSYFGRHLASHGYLVILPQHAGSDTGALFCLTCDAALMTDWLLNNPTSGGGMTVSDRQLLQSSTNDPKNLVDRPLDVSFTIDQLAKDPTLIKSADATRIGVAGHSFGAYTSMTIGGMLVDLPPQYGGVDRSFHDAGVSAALLMSPPGPGAMGISDGAWSRYHVPSMFMTGTHDYGWGEAASRWRRTAFEQIRGVERYLVTLEGAGHATFANQAEVSDSIGEQAKLFGLATTLLSSIGLNDPGLNSPIYQVDLIQALSTAFFDAYLKGDGAAMAWLAGYVATEHPQAEVEFSSG